MDHKFSALWPRSTPRLQAGIAAFSLIGTAVAMATGAGAVAAGLVGVWQLAAAGALALATHGFIRFASSGVIAEKSVRESGEHAPAFLQNRAEDLFAKAGLTQKGLYPIVMVTNSRRSPPPAWLRWYTRKRSVVLDHGAFTIPVGAGKDRNKIMIGMGENAVRLLDKHEITAVLAHEVGHTMNRAPQLNRLYSVPSKLAAGLALTSLLTMNMPALAVTLGGYTLARIFYGIGNRLDEERADRSSLGLYPHPTALGTALNKMMPEFKKALYPRGRDFNYMLDLAKRTLMGTHPDVDRRVKDNSKYFEESAAFHRANDIAPDPYDYACDHGLQRPVWLRDQIVPAARLADPRDKLTQLFNRHHGPVREENGFQGNNPIGGKYGPFPPRKRAADDVQPR